MGANSKIEWCHHTFNPWYGCTKVSEACKFCYAESWGKRSGLVQWGPKAPRRLSSDAKWKEPAKWNAEAMLLGIRYRVFCASLGDVFDDHPSILPEWRNRLWSLIAATPHLDWLLLTKRPTNWAYFLPVAGCRPPFTNVRLGVTIEDEMAVAARGAPLQFASYCGWPTFVSYEPAMGSVDWRPLLGVNAIGWLIAGGESGHHARPAHPEWFRQARDQCAAANVPFLFKQWGEWAPGSNWPEDETIPSGQSNDFGDATLGDNGSVWRVGKKIAGRILDGREHNAFPAALAA